MRESFRPPRLLEPFYAPVRTLRHYRPADLRRDLVAGLTAAVVDLPQAMALALIAGVPPVHGVYTAIVLGFFGALFTSGRVLAVGPTNTQSLLVAAVVSRLTSDPEVYLQLVFGLSLLKGLIQVAFGAAGVGALARYVSRSVMIGFTAAAGFLIVAGQLAPLFGLPRAKPASALPGVLATLERVALQLRDANPYALGIGAFSLASIVLARRLSPLVPGPLLALVGGALVVLALGLGPEQIALAPMLPRGLPELGLPDLTLSQAEALLGGAVALALLGTLETVMIAKSTALRPGAAIRADHEFFSQGIANVIGSLLQCLPGSASFSRTALLLRAGASTRFAGLYGSVLTFVLFLGLAPLADAIPLASLAAILIVVGVSLIDVRAVARIVRSSRGDAAVCLATLASALLLPLAYAIYLGIFLNLALYLRQAGRLHMSELVPTPEGAYAERPLPRAGISGRALVFLQLEGDLFFAIADELEERLAQLQAHGVRVAIFRLKRAHWIDTSVLFVLEQFAQSMRAAGGHVILCGVRPELREQLHDFGLDAVIGEENVIDMQAGVFASARVAHARGRALLARDAEAGVRPPD